LQKVLENSTQINVQNKNGETAILVAAKNYNAKGVELLIFARADVNLPDKYGMTPLMIAACNGMEETVNALLNTGANVNVVDNADGLTAFSCAVSNKEWKCAKMLRRHTKINYEDLKKLPKRHVWAYIKYTPIFG
jgi:ankyrin repeat protein